MSSSELADSFNTMSDSLREQFEVLQALAEIDRLILESPELESIIDRLLVHLRGVTGCACASVTLVDRDDPEFGRVYFSDADQARKQAVQRVALQGRAREDDVGAMVELGAGATIAPHLATLAGGGASVAWVQPVYNAAARVAILALGYADAADASDTHRRFAHDFADRLAVALSNLEREERLYVQAHYDSLTRLPNRQLLKDRLANELAHAQRSGEQLAVLYVDLDNFKRVNDTLGHDAGDGLLTVVGERLSGAVKRTDTVARLGGDEFVVLLTSLVSEEAAGRSAERMLSALGKPLRVGGREYHVRASIGIAVYPQDGDTIEALLKNADTALYRAKDSGRGRATYFEPQMNARALERWSLETGLLRALQARQFVLHYQPQIDIRTGALTGVEALIRWMCPEHGMRMPGEFIGAAEDTGLIVDIGAWVLFEACSQYTRWREQGLEVPRVAVNVSANQLRQPNFANQVRRALLDNDMPPWALELEITESVLLAADGPSGEGLRELSALGVKVSLDDFGTGYSSLNYLRRHPVHVIKIDRSFIADTPQDAEAKAITSAIIAMARSLQKETIAEGVETPQQLKLLERLGCTTAQGFHFSQALPADDLLRFVRERGENGYAVAPGAHVAPVRNIR